MRFSLMLYFCCFTVACVYKGERHIDGETWIVRSTFVMKCTINSDGSWIAKVVGCRTSGGVFVEPGHTITEKDTKYECTSLNDGRVEIIRTYYNTRRQMSCEGHQIGSSWVSQRNFHKLCTEEGARIIECLTDSGIPVPLNQHLILSGIVYRCTRYANGTVTIHREVLPVPINFKNHLEPVVVLGPMWKKFRNLERFLKLEEIPEAEPTLGADFSIHSDQANQSRRPVVSCVSKGVVHQPGDTWVSDKWFTKKCMSDGSIVILNCRLKDGTIMEINTHLKIGGITYKCYRNRTDSYVHFEVSIE